MTQDAQLQTAVLAELAWEPSITAAHIGVTADAGTVTLTGHVESYSQKHAAEMATGRVKGVKGIAEEIEVRLPYTVKRDDADIVTAAVSRLAWNAATPADAIKVKVEDGWLSLSGEVDWHFQMEDAEREVRGLLGVVGVSNLITIKSRVDTGHVSRDIQHALGRAWFDPEKVHVSAENGRVKLTGAVPSWHDWHMAATTAWRAPGTTSVENDIVIAL